MADAAYQDEHQDHPLMAFIGSPNIALDLEDDRLASIGDRVIREYDIDQASRSEWEQKCDAAMDLALQVAEKKTFPFENASNIKYPLMTTAAIQFGARAT